MRTPHPTRRVSVGILAHDEEERITATVASILRQELVVRGEHEVEIVVVANGCSDSTAYRARTTLAAPREHPGVLSARVVDEPLPGKARAWNRFVHELSRPDADYLVLVDADIELLGDQVLGSLVDVLETDAHAVVSTDRPVKDVVLVGGGGAMGRLSALASMVTGNDPEEGGPTWICGQLYCARADELRRIWLPINTMCDDSFVYTMVTTQGLTTPEDPRRVVLAPGATHLFEAYLTLARILRHQRWILLGKEINRMVYADLADEPRDAGEVVRERNLADPRWLEKLVQHKRGGLRTARAASVAVTGRAQVLQGRRDLKALVLLPAALCAGALDAAVTWSAHRELRRTGGQNYWRASGGWGHDQEGAH